jgi:hypothetical protein|tara:strand:+ start:806 stop:1807 length:1002 start_codon:yes stop_codon:yes gene_type:complete
MIYGNNFNKIFLRLSVLILIIILPPFVNSDPEINLDSLVINNDTVLQPIIYHITNGIIINSSDVTLDCNGATLIGENFDCNQTSSYGIYIFGKSNITIKNCSIQDYLMGIFMGDSLDIELPRTENINFEYNIINNVCVTLSSQCAFGCNNITIINNKVNSSRYGHFSGTLKSSIISNNILESEGWFCSIYNSLDYLRSQNNTMTYISQSEGILNILTSSISVFLESCIEEGTFLLNCPGTNEGYGCNLTQFESQFGISGQEAFCGDGFVNGGETCSSCELDVGPCPGNSPGSGDSSSSLLEEIDEGVNGESNLGIWDRVKTTMNQILDYLSPF